MEFLKIISKCIPCDRYTLNIHDGRRAVFPISVSSRQPFWNGAERGSSSCFPIAVAVSPVGDLEDYTLTREIVT